MHTAAIAVDVDVEVVVASVRATADGVDVGDRMGIGKGRGSEVATLQHVVVNDVY